VIPLKKEIMAFFIFSLVLFGCSSNKDISQVSGEVVQTSMKNVTPINQTIQPEINDTFKTKLYRNREFKYSLEYPENFTYRVDLNAVVFSGENDEMYLIAEVIPTKFNGGKFETTKEVINDYFNLYVEQDGKIESTKIKRVNNETIIEIFTISYTKDIKKWENRYAIGKNANNFYILQAVIPSEESEMQNKNTDYMFEHFKYPIDK
jgi:hypothetical protein